MGYLLGERSAGVECTDIKLERGLTFIWLLIDVLEELSLPLKVGPAAEWNEMRQAELGRLIPARPVFVWEFGLLGAFIRHTIWTLE